MSKQNIPELPDSLKPLAERYLERLTQHSDADIRQQLNGSDLQKLTVLLGLSDFIAENLISHPGWIADTLSPQNQINDRELLHGLLQKVESETQLQQVLRQYRNKRMIQIAALDLLNMQSIETSLQAVSMLADALIMESYHWLYSSLCGKYATPMGEHGQQHLLIIGMGKLGGMELNFSSDIDLIFVYPQKGDIHYRNKSMEHQQFFTKLGQKLISSLHQTTIDGQVFRVDMRLRPFGDSGPLVTSLAALEDYYQEQGREWERYAMVKGRILNETSPYTAELQQVLKPFVYRRYIDYSVMESLRKMKQLIRQEVRRRHLDNNIKLGSGGIREIEFILQCIQLTRGGKNKDIQEKNVLKLMALLKAKHILPAEKIAQLKEQYLFLRKSEHCLQQFADQQTQELPEKETDQHRLCCVMQQPDFQAYLEDLKQRTTIVSIEFESLIGDSPQDNNDDSTAMHDLWLLELSNSEAMPLLKEVYNAENSDTILALLTEYKTEFQRRPMGVRGKESLDKLMPSLINTCLLLDTEDNDDKVMLIKRVMHVIRSILRRTAYIQLLLENHAALFNLIQLCHLSDWVAEQLARFPLLLDELLNPNVLTNPTPVEQYPDLLRQQLLRITEEDLEQQMESLRQFKLSHQLRIAAADLYETLPIMKVSDHLTWLAETIVKEAVNSAWRQMTDKYGYPKGADDDNTGFLVTGYGKMGGIELGYSSDLDLVFLHNCNSTADTTGPKQIDSKQFYVKLAQRIMHLFNTKTSSGELYEVDLRLRPSGNSGLLVSGIEAYREYLMDDAWTWEHQALVRSRAIYGHLSIQQRFSEIRQEVLCRPRDQRALSSEVTDMRDKMRQHLDKSDAQHIDLKQGRGTIADIEFLTQYWTLKSAHAHPDITRWSDNVRIIETLVQDQLIPDEWGNTLTDAYLKIRNLSHRKALQGTPNLMDADELRKEREKVCAIWDVVFGAGE